MNVKRMLTYIVSVFAMASILLGSVTMAVAQNPTPPPPSTPDAGNPPPGYHGRPTPAERQAAAERAKAARAASPSAQLYVGGSYTTTADYFGTVPNYANSPQAQIDIVTTVSDLGGVGTGAAISPIVGGLTGLVFAPGGAGYTIAPSVVITGGGGFGATAQAVVFGGQVVGVSLTNPGMMYKSAPTVTLVGGGPGVTLVPPVSATVDPATTATSWPVTGLQIDNPGSGYITPTITFTSTNLAVPQASATLSVTAGAITGFTLTAGGLYPLVTDAAGKVVGIRKFVDGLPGLGPTGANDLGQYIPVAVADTTTYPGTDYYEIGLVQYAEQLHSDLPPTLLREYVQLATGVVTPTVAVAVTNTVGGVGVPVRYRNGQQVYAMDAPHYLGPLILASQNRPTRIKFYNFLPNGAAGNLFIPTDTTYMGAGNGPDGSVTAINLTNGGSGYTSVPVVTITGGGGTGAKAEAVLHVNPATGLTDGVINQIRVTDPGTGYTNTVAINVAITGGGGTNAAAFAVVAGAAGPYTQNRATLHLHGGNTPWISDGTPHQWITPAGEATAYPHGVSVYNVPDMPDPGDGSQTFFYTNQQSARLMFYHDHAYGITRLNVYAGEAAGYLLQDAVEMALMNGGTITPSVGAPVVVAAGTVPTTEVPLVIQDKTFVDATKIYFQDPTWAWGSLPPGQAHTGDLWFPHVYMPNQNPYDLQGVNAMGRWDYGPWFWPPFTGLQVLPAPNPFFGTSPVEGPVIPGTPNPSGVPEGFMDTMMVNGTPYPTITLDPKAYRFRILNAANDRMMNLSLFQAASSAPMWVAGALNDPAAGEVPMVPAVQGPGMTWVYPDVLDGRAGGVPDPKAAGPSWLQIGSEGGLLPGLATIAPQPVGYEYNRRSIVVLNVSQKALFLGPAERADVVVDFSQFAGKTLILYNDAPAPVPAFDPRIDYYTGDMDQTDSGGAPTTLPGYGPNTRTIMQIVIKPTTPAPAFNPAPLAAALPAAFNASQPVEIVPQGPAYNAVYGGTFPSNNNAYLRLQDYQMTFTPIGLSAPVTLTLQDKAIQELFTVDYGRMNATLGVEIPNTTGVNQTTIPFGYVDPPTEILRTGDGVAAIGTAADGTQIWKITHNGVDTHAIHFHMFNVQVINRVGWDGQIRYPDANELGWKETVRMHPLEIIFIATRPIIPNIPFTVGNSYRELDVTTATGSPQGFFGVDPLNNPIPILNHVINFGWEYVWHCHLLGHEENDMMRAMTIGVPPNLVPAGLAITYLVNPQRLRLTWSDTSLNATHYTIDKAPVANFSTGVTTVVVPRAPGVNQFWDDPNIAGGSTYYYRVSGTNWVGDATTYTAAVGFPSMQVSTGPVGPVSFAVGIIPPSNLRRVGAVIPIGPTFARVSMAWTLGQTAGITGYIIGRSTSLNGVYTLAGVVNNPTATTFTDGTAPRGRTVYYRVRSYILATGVTSAWSNTLTVVVP